MEEAGFLLDPKASAVFLFPAGTVNGKYCCPQLFINHRCFSGPYLNKGRIAELPQSVGPGKCVLVLKEVKRVRQWSELAYFHGVSKMWADSLKERTEM